MTLYQKLLKYKIIPILYFLLLCGLIAAGIWWFVRSGLLPLIRDPEALGAYFESLGVGSYFIVFLLQFFAVILIPATGGVIVVTSAALFGFVPTFLICSTATILGSCVSYALSRYLGRPLVELFLSRHKLDRYISSFEDRKNFLLFVMFFFPFFPDDLLCYAAGLVNIRWKYFLLAAVLGRPWGLLINCLVGISVFSLPSYGYIPAILFVIVTVAVSWRFGSAWERMIIERVNRRKARYREKIESVRSRSGSAYENKN
ncbi:MAG: TVP38/TMEM64 family protein [Bacillota bacterium]|jgi:uncharacterized membrane protein YdjX (TVP38/TMEM64 family)